MSKVSMPSERESITHRFKIGTGEGSVKGYITVGLLENGQPGEIFITLKKTGTLERGLCHILAVVISMALQHGVPLERIVTKLKDERFEPAGFTSNPEIPFAKSIVDYVARWIERRFLGVSGTQEASNHQEAPADAATGLPGA